MVTSPARLAVLLRAAAANVGAAAGAAAAAWAHSVVVAPSRPDAEIDLAAGTAAARARVHMVCVSKRALHRRAACTHPSPSPREAERGRART